MEPHAGVAATVEVEGDELVNIAPPAHSEDRPGQDAVDATVQELGAMLLALATSCTRRAAKSTQVETFLLTQAAADACGKNIKLRSRRDKARFTFKYFSSCLSRGGERGREKKRGEEKRERK